MRGSVQRKLVAFVVLSAVGVLYASANYLGLVDKVLGRDYAVTADLAGTGGLYEGSLVTYRGVEVGKVSSMTPRGDGVSVHMTLKDGSRIPKSSPIYVHNGSAVGEQYLDFEPLSNAGPFLTDGDTIQGNLQSLPVDEGDLLVDMDRFVGSVNKGHLRTVVSELGKMFYNTGHPLQHIIDSGNTLINEASAHQAQTIRLLEEGRTVLRTQQRNAGNIKAFADGMAQLTGALRRSDGDFRTILQGGPGSLAQIQALLKGLQPILPVFLSNLVTVDQVTVLRLKSVEQLLVTYPVVIASGFSGTTKDGYGHVHVEYTQDTPPCRKGFLPPSKWRPPQDLSDAPIYLKAHCAEPLPYTARGSNYAPPPGNGGARVAPYDPTTGTLAAGGRKLVLSSNIGDVYGEDAWKWMLIGPTMEK